MKKPSLRFLNFISGKSHNEKIKLAESFGYSPEDLQQHSTATPPANMSGNNNTIEVKTMTGQIYGHRADGTPISREYAEKNLNTWYSEAATFTELGDMVVQLMQSMTMANAPEDFRITSESDFQAEVKRSKEALGLN